MNKREIIIPSESKESAIEEAIKLLKTVESNLDCEEIDDGKYHFTVKNADAEIEIELSDDLMDARINKYLPPIGNGKGLTEEMLMHSLASIGVKYGIDDKKIKQIIDLVSKRKEPHNLVLANGKQPTVQTGSRISGKGDLKYPCLAGTTICHLTPGKPPEKGINVKGEEVALIERTDAVKDVEIIAGQWVEVSEYKQNAKSLIYGFASIQADKVDVEPLYEVSDDKQSVYITVYAKSSMEEEVTHESIKDSFAKQGIIHGFISENIKGALDKISGNEKDSDDNKDTSNSFETPEYIEHILSFQGTAPVNGEDAKIEMFFEQEEVSSNDDNQEQVDYHEQNSIRNVTAGQRLAVITPAKNGIQGKDIYGNAVPAENGNPVELQAGENVSKSNDELKFIADVDGILIIRDNQISVTDVLEIKGDVDFNSGNVHIDKGSVLITGTIRTDFVVDVADSIIVGEAIEGAEVRAGGDIEVKHGIVMQEKGCVSAEGSITALFAENATIVSSGDLIVANDISNSNINVKGKVIVTKGKGKIMGGCIIADSGIEVNELGTEMGVATDVTVGGEPECVLELQEELKILQENIKKIERVIGNAEPREVLNNTPPAKRKAIASVIKAKIGAVTRVNEIEKIIKDSMDSYKEKLNCRINVHNTLYPGVKISIADEHITTDRAMQACSIFYDLDDHKIKVGPISDK